MNNHTIVPAEIAEKYIPFLYNHFPGIEAKHGNKKVKAVILSNESSLGKFIRINSIRAEKPIYSKIGLYLSVSESKIKGTIYKHEDGTKHFLKLPKEVLSDFNKLIEDIFIITFVSFVDGYCIKQRLEKKRVYRIISEAVDYFFLNYELDEYNLKKEVLRTNYYRYKKQPLLKKFILTN